jgi:hypothetical protein
MDREALAYAAGLFDGEGTIWTRGRSPGLGLRLFVQQNHPDVLERFRAAVGLGRVVGPYTRKGVHKPFWQYEITDWRGVQAVVAMLWIFLGVVKREQIVRVFRQYREGRTRPIGPKSRFYQGG